MTKVSNENPTSSLASNNMREVRDENPPRCRSFQLPVLEAPEGLDEVIELLKQKLTTRYAWRYLRLWIQIQESGWR
jgi:hypothetical protein